MSKTTCLDAWVSEPEYCIVQTNIYIGSDLHICFYLSDVFFTKDGSCSFVRKCSQHIPCPHSWCIVSSVASIDFCLFLSLGPLVSKYRMHSILSLLILALVPCPHTYY